MPRMVLAVLGSVALAGCAALDSGFGATAATERPWIEGVGLATTPSAPPPAPVTTKPPTPAFVEERARQAYETGRWDVAEGYYLQWIRLQPNDAGPWFQLGNLYAEQGRLDAAERAYREALRRRDEARTLHNLGLVQVRLGVGALREAQRRLPPDDSARRETREFLQTLLEAAQ
ncbi:MAG: tetratricopeptide repeat protein [Candidatus Contendobacter sp.]|nr:tetratricopeptide repeat protein [Candidatus Contendobacter sp.]